MSGEILENTSEEIADETAEESTYASSEEISSEEEQVIEENSKPRTKAGMVKAIYDQLNTLKKADLSDSYESIIGATLAEQDDDEDDEEDDDEEDVEEGKLPPALQKAIDKKKGKSDDDEDEEEVKETKDVEDIGGETGAGSPKKALKVSIVKAGKKKKIKKEDLEINVEKDVKALMEGEETLSDEFKTKAATIFESAVSTKILSEVNSRIEILEGEYAQELEEAKEEHSTQLTEKVDGYMSYVVEEWMKDNELAVERGIRSELVEDFMTGLRNLFQEHYIDIPEEKVDLVDDLFGKVEELEGKLDEEINRSVDLKKELSEYKRDETIREVSDNLADTEKEKLSKLAEGIEYEDKEQFNEKLGVLKENYFPTNDAKAETSSDGDPVTNSEELNEEVVDPSMTHYVDALARFGQNS
jgi:hypothetical protein